MAADHDMMVDSSDSEVQPPLAKRAKFTHISPIKKRFEREMLETEYSSKRAKKSLPDHEKPEFFYTDVIAKRRRLHVDLNLRRKPKRFYLTRSKPIRQLEHISRPSGTVVGHQPTAGDDYQSSSQDDLSRVQSDISQSDNKEAEVTTSATAHEERQRQHELERKAIEQELLEKRVEDRIRQYRTEEVARGRIAELKSRIQARVHEEVARRAEGKSPSELLMEFCGIRCSDYSRDSLKRVYRRALAQVHPDRIVQKPLEDIVEAEEIYKILHPIYCTL